MNKSCKGKLIYLLKIKNSCHTNDMLEMAKKYKNLELTYYSQKS